MKNRLLALAFALGLSSLIGVALARADQPKHLEAGLRLVDEIVATQAKGVFADAQGVLLNRYGGSWGSATDGSYIRFFDAATGTLPGNYTTCAPLVTHLLKYCYNWSWSSYSIYDPLLKQSVKTASPKAYRYVSAIKTHVGFTQQLTKLADVQPGDIAAFWDIGTDEGHAMIVVAINLGNAKAYPSALAGANPTLAGTTYYEMTVLDSSSTGHSADTRLVTTNGASALTGGVGTGVMGILVNAAGEVVGHTWSLPTSDYATQPAGWLSGLHSRLQLQTSRELVFGRLPALP